MTAERTSPYRIGIMTVDVSGFEGFQRIATAGITHFKALLERETNLTVDTFAFQGPRVDTEAGAYQPLDFIQLAIAERAEREFSFLIVVTDVDLSTSRLTYTLAMPSPLTNVGIVSVRRLNPSYWGYDPDIDLAGKRLGTVIMHTFGRLLNLDHIQDPKNIMSPTAGVESLDSKTDFTERQREHMRRNLPKEALDMATGVRKTRFAMKTIFSRFGAVLRGVASANPLRLVTKLPTMIATALSVIVVLIFAAETWDYAGQVSPSKLAIFALFAFATSVFVLYRAFAFDAIVSRDGKILESTIITTAATALSLLATVVLLFIMLAILMWCVAEFAFPDILKSTWSTVEPVTSFGDHVKLSVFLASIGVLAGSLGGAADSRNIVRNVLFAHREV